MKLLTLLIVLLGLNMPVFGQYLFWEQLNGPNGGVVFTTSLDSTQRLIIGTGVAGIMTSTNEGGTWSPMNKGLRTLQIKRVESGPDDYVYMYNHIFDIARYHDIDAGWEYLDPWEPAGATRVIHDIHVNKRGKIFLSSHKFGIRRSTDHGDTWEWGQWFLDDTTRKQLTFRRIAATVSQDTMYALTDSGYVYRSIDDGDSWTLAAGRQPSPKVVAECFEVSAGGDLIIASQRDIPGGKFYRSTDGGNTWSLVFSHPEDHIAYALVRSNANGDLYAATHSPPDSKQQTHQGGFFRSTDNGASWQLRDATERGDENFSLAVNAEGDIFQGSEPDGVAQSTDRGFTWSEKNDGLMAQFLDGVVVNSKGDVFTLTLFSVYRSENPNPGSLNPANIWVSLNVEQIESFQQPLLYIAPGDVLFHGSYFGLYRSTDKGDHWEHVIPGSATINNFIYDVEAAPNGNLYAATNETGLMVSSDNGVNWSPVPNLPPSVRMTAVTFGSNDTVMAAGNDSRCYRSINSGINWTTLSETTDLPGVKRMFHHPDGSFIAQITDGVKRSTDGGETWERIYPTEAIDSLGTEVRDMYRIFLDSKNNLLVATGRGIWRSTKPPFNEWEQVATGITASDYRKDHYCNVSQISEDPNTGHLYAATRGQSMYRSRNPNLAVKLSPSVSLPSGINYPNPFADRTSIDVKLNKAGYAEIDIYTAVGERIMSIRKGNVDAGSHTFTVNGSDLASGSYLYVVKVDGDPVARGWMKVVH